MSQNRTSLSPILSDNLGGSYVLGCFHEYGPWPYKCLYSTPSLYRMETWPYKFICLYSIPSLNHTATWPYNCLYSILSRDRGIAALPGRFHTIATVRCTHFLRLSDFWRSYEKQERWRLDVSIQSGNGGLMFSSVLAQFRLLIIETKTFVCLAHVHTCTMT